MHKRAAIAKRDIPFLFLMEKRVCFFLSKSIYMVGWRFRIASCCWSLKSFCKCMTTWGEVTLWERLNSLARANGSSYKRTGTWTVLPDSSSMLIRMTTGLICCLGAGLKGWCCKLGFTGIGERPGGLLLWLGGLVLSSSWWMALRNKPGGGRIDAGLWDLGSGFKDVAIPP